MKTILCYSPKVKTIVCLGNAFPLLSSYKLSWMILRMKTAGCHVSFSDWRHFTRVNRLSFIFIPGRFRNSVLRFRTIRRIRFDKHLNKGNGLYSHYFFLMETRPVLFIGLVDIQMDMISCQDLFINDLAGRQEKSFVKIKRNIYV